MEILFIASIEKTKNKDKFIRHPSSFPILAQISMKARQEREAPPNIHPKKQRLYKLRFLQKLGCQKPFWDQARLLWPGK